MGRLQYFLKCFYFYIMFVFADKSLWQRMPGPLPASGVPLKHSFCIHCHSWYFQMMSIYSITVHIRLISVLIRDSDVEKVRFLYARYVFRLLKLRTPTIINFIRIVRKPQFENLQHSVARKYNALLRRTCKKANRIQFNLV